jgi:hypothetical protein
MANLREALEQMRALSGHEPLGEGRQNLRKYTAPPPPSKQHGVTPEVPKKLSPAERRALKAAKKTWQEEAKGLTYPKARVAILDFLKKKGWAVKSGLKIPHATSPSKNLRLWFKKQAVHFTSGPPHRFGDARTVSYDLDIRKISPERFLAQIQQWDKQGLLKTWRGEEDEVFYDVEYVLSERKKKAPTLAHSWDKEKPTRPGAFKVSSKFLRFWKDEMGTGGPSKLMFKKVQDRIAHIPRADLPKIWKLDNMADTQDLISGKPKKAFQMWLRNIGRIDPKMKGYISRVSENVPLVYYGYMARVVGNDMADIIFKRYFATESGHPGELKKKRAPKKEERGAAQFDDAIYEERALALLEKEMTPKQREALPAKAFVFPEKEAWPIHDVKHALIALQYVKTGFRGKKSEYPAVIAAVKKKWGKNKEVAAALAGLGK